jgi:hypothetical protein
MTNNLFLSIGGIMKDGDIYRWSYNEKTMKEKSHGNNGGTTYWSVSQIGIWNEDKKRLVDTYWSSQNRWFSENDINEKLVLKFVANLNNLEPVRHRSEFNNYDDSDCINISHPNMMSGGFYIKKGAVPSIDKKRRVLEAHIKHEEGQVKWHKRNLEFLRKDLENLTAETHMPYDQHVYVE